MDTIIKLESHDREHPLEDQAQGHKLVFEWLNEDFSRLPIYVWSEELTTNGCRIKTLWRTFVHISRIPESTEMFVELHRTDKREFSVTQKFCVSLMNNKQEVLFKNTCSSVFPSEDTSRSTSVMMFLPNVIFSSLPDDILNIRIDMTINGCCDSTTLLHEVLKATPQSESVHLLQLMHDFGRAYESDLFADFNLPIDGEIIRVNKFVLSARSSFFKGMFESTDSSDFEFITMDENKIALEAFITYLYTGIFNEIELDTMHGLYSLASKCKDHFLQKICGVILLSNVNANKVCQLLHMADKYEDNGIKNAAMRFIAEHFDQVRATRFWKPLLEEFPNLLSEVTRIRGFQK